MNWPAEHVKCTELIRLALCVLVYGEKSPGAVRASEGYGLPAIFP